MAVTLKRQPIPFGKYLLLDRINIGGMAEVWRAKTFGAGGFERLVAIKRILPNIAEDEEFIAMFIDEAKITVQLAHANIAQIYELAHISNSYFIAMEYVAGKDMRAIFDRCRKRNEPAPVPLVAHVISRCCEGLDYAHRKKDGRGQDLGIVHRDVSPQNVLISYEGEVKVIDFGIAKAAGKATKTQHGILKGKFGYMSPEQIRGVPLDRRSDIFAIGICTYEMLTGERLFVGESDFSVLEKVRRADVLPPSHFNRKIPEQLERLVMKALAKDVEDRYQFASDLAEDLNRFLYGSGQSFGRAELAAFMRATFAEDYEREKVRQQEAAEVRAPDAMLATIEAGAGVAPARPAAGPPQVGAAPPPVPSMPGPAARAALAPPPPPQPPGPPADEGSTAASADAAHKHAEEQGGAGGPGAPTPSVRQQSGPSRPRLTVAQPASVVQREEPSVTVLVDKISDAPGRPAPEATRVARGGDEPAQGPGDEAGEGTPEPSTSPGSATSDPRRVVEDGLDRGGTAITELPVADDVGGGVAPRPRGSSAPRTAPLMPLPATSSPTPRPAAHPQPLGSFSRGSAEPPRRPGRVVEPPERPDTPEPFETLQALPPVAESSSRRAEHARAQRSGRERHEAAGWPRTLAVVLLLVAGAVGGTAAYKLFRPKGLLRIDVPPELAGRVSVQINATALTEPDGSLLRDWPQLREVPAGKVTVMLKAEGYEPVVETVDVKPGNEFTSVTQQLRPRTPPKESPPGG